MFTQTAKLNKRIIFYQQKRKKVTFAPSNLSVAQLVEQLTLNQWVTGSNPVRETIIKDNHLLSNVLQVVLFFTFVITFIYKYLQLILSCYIVPDVSVICFFLQIA